MSFTVVADLAAYTGAGSPTKELIVRADSDTPTMFDAATVPLYRGTALIDLPAIGDLGAPAAYIFTRNRWGLTGPAVTLWRVPAQPTGTTVLLEQFAGTIPTPLPPDFDVELLAAQIADLQQFNTDAPGPVRFVLNSNGTVSVVQDPRLITGGTSPDPAVFSRRTSGGTSADIDPHARHVDGGTAA